MTRVFSHLYVFRVYNDHSNNFTDSIFIGEVFQIEVSDVVDLVHPLEIIKFLSNFAWPRLHPSVEIASLQ